MSLEFNIEYKSDITIIYLSGKILTDSDLSSLRESFDSLKQWKIIVDLSELTHMNSTGISVLIKLLTKSRINNGDVFLLNPNSGINKIIEITRLNDIFSVHQSLEDAINQYSN